MIQKAEPDLVFMDVHMPGQDGIGVVRELRESGMALPHFIFVTAYEQYAVEAFRLEAMDYLLKPLDKVRLAETIDRARRAVHEKQKAVHAGALAPARAAPHQAADPQCQSQLHRGCAGRDLCHHR